MKIRNLLFFCCWMFAMEGIAQETPSFNPNISQKIASMNLPIQMSEKRQGKEYQENLKFWAYPFQGQQVDLRDFKRRTPQFKGPDVLPIVTTDLSAFQNPTVLLGLIKGFKNNVDALVVILAINYDSERVTFFIDKNLSRNFIEGVEIKQLSASDEPYEVIIKPRKGNVSTQKLWLKVPKVAKPSNRKTSRKIQVKSKILDQFAGGLHLGFGVGQLAYQFDNLEKGFPSWYDVNYVEKNIGLAASYNTARFRFALSTHYQNLYYYTSYLNIRIREREVISVENIRENVDLETNKDQHSANQFNYAATLGIRFHLTKVMEIQPFFSYGRIHYLPGNYQNDYFGVGSTYELPPSSFFETGLRFEFATGRSQGLFLDLMYHQNTWRPVGYFESFDHENLDLSNSMWKGNIGYRVGF